MHRVLKLKSAIGLKTVGVGAVTMGIGGLVYALENSLKVHAGDFQCHPFPLPWSHKGYLDSLDMASVRRGYQVYKQVCAACHSMKFIRFRHFIDKFMSEDEAKTEAAEALIDDIDDQGQPTKRPAVLNDYLPNPYKNKKEAMAANNGAAPPDLSLMAMARHGGDDYIFSLLTGYFDPPAGVTVDEGKAYNPYFPGGVISMPQQLFDEGIEYPDGTPATQSQQAKDMTTFLRFAAEPYHDIRKQWAWKIIFLTPIVWFVLLHAKRHAWSFIKSQKIVYTTVKGREWTPESSAPEPKDKGPWKLN